MHGVTPSVRADRGSVYSGVTPIHTSGITSCPVSVGGDVVANKNVSVTKLERRLGLLIMLFVILMMLMMLCLLIRAGLLVFLHAGVDGDGTVGAGTYGRVCLL